VRLTILSRASDLARLQALLVGHALAQRWPDLEIAYQTRASSGDRDTATPLAALPDKGAFTADLSDALESGGADLVVHSWKDLPLEPRPGSAIVATLERADPRDVLLVRREAIGEEPGLLRVLSSSPRRSWLLDQALPGLLPWSVERAECTPVRGNVPTRLRKLTTGDSHALVVAKAALDRLLGFGAPFQDVAQAIRTALDRCRWLVLPVREVPGAPAQGALAIEVRTDRPDVIARVQAIRHDPTWEQVAIEREVLAEWGGGCHEAMGATALDTPHGRLVSVRGRRADGHHEQRWSLVGAGAEPPRVAEARIWPCPRTGRSGPIASSGRRARGPGAGSPRGASGCTAPRMGSATRYRRQSICWPAGRSSGAG
jgi:hydroxymethylbilane synthase